MLAARGFICCPRLVERIDSCSVTLTYLPGRALSSPVPRWAADARTLIRATRFVSAFSMTAAGMRASMAKSDWLTQPDSAGDDLVHGDPHPTNLIFSPCRRPTGLIDFELATLGPGIWNLISLIFGWGSAGAGQRHLLALRAGIVPEPADSDHTATLVQACVRRGTNG